MTGVPTVAPTAAAKVDPESLVLRGRPQPVVRFRRGVIVGGAAALSAALVGLTWIALKPTTFRSVVANNSGRPFERATPEALAAAPHDYRDVPVLGPPLPGDLGRPILDKQRQLGEVSAETSAVADEHVRLDAVGERHQRSTAEQTARSSPLAVPLSGRPAGTSQGMSNASAGDAAPAQTIQAPAPERKIQLGDWSQSDTTPHAVVPSASRWIVAAGTVIPASLLTGLNSDLPGVVLAQVTENVRDTFSGREILIPQGARLIGRYDSDVSYGQKRAFVVWQRILFPDGSSLRLDNMPVGDAAGYSGLTDRVDGHSWQLIKGAMLSSLLGVGSQLSFGADHGIIRAIRETLQQNGSQAGEQIVSKGLTIQPTIRVRPGWPVRVLVSEDLTLQPWRG